jgi:hypothetical protein
MIFVWIGYVSPRSNFEQLRFLSNFEQFLKTLSNFEQLRFLSNFEQLRFLCNSE